MYHIFPHYNPRGETYDPPFTNKKSKHIDYVARSKSYPVLDKDLKLNTLEFKHLATTVFILFFSNCPPHPHVWLLIH